MMNLLSVLGQSIEVDKEELTVMVKTCEKCQKDLEDYKSIISEGKVVVEAMKVRLIEKEQIILDLNSSIDKVKIAYHELEKSHKKKKFWVWIKGAVSGIVIGAATVFLLII